ncbi:MAG TPA: HlyD family efflux transporter periplasmic adaptor subunit [Tepidisphaeraceae bacterium]|nr:HlyD family efflux transporter periplasmic adaptor subunit [Tepidisphaeraceae bacterium]
MASGIDVQSQQKQSQEDQQRNAGAPGAHRSQLVQRLLDASANLPQFIHDLIQTQAVTVAGTEAAAFLLERAQAPDAAEGEEGEKAVQLVLRPIAHIRPDDSAPEIRAKALDAFKEIITPCIQQGKDGAFEVGAPNSQAESQFCLVTLLRSEGQVVAASAVITRCVNLDRARQRLMSMQLVAGYFELFTLRRTSEQSRLIAQSHQHVLQLTTSVATAEGFESAAMNLCNELATRAGAVRVSMGWVKGNNVKVKALSHTEQFDKKQELVVQLEKVMEECRDQDQIVQYEPSGKSSENVTREAQVLSRMHGGHAVLSIPLRRREEIIGVLALEFLPNQPLGPQVAQGLGVAADLLAPQLYDRFQNDRWLITKAGISTREVAKKAIGPKHMLAKLIIALCVITLLVVCNWVPFADLRMMHRVTAPFQFAPVQKIAIAAPFESTIEQVGEINGERVRPGVRVKQGDLLLKLKTYELEQQLYDTEQRISQARGQENQAEEDGDTTKAQIHRAERLGFEAQRDLLTYRIERATVRAAFDGVILKGEVEDKVGAPVKEGDLLFEVGPIHDLKVELTVNERDVQYLKDGRDPQTNAPLPDGQRQKGQLATTSNPGEKYGFKVDRIVPMGEAKEGANGFKVYAVLDAAPRNEWRPGMMGEARIDVQKRPLIWLWTHRVIDFVRLKLWLPF